MAHGSASAAKLITQRKRRLAAVAKEARRQTAQAQQALAVPLTAALQSPSDNIEIVDSGDVPQQGKQETEKGKRKKVKGEFNLLQVTAGTPFMARLKNAICFWACSRLQSDPKYHLTRIYVSGPDVPGEGEIKIMEFIVSHANAECFPAPTTQERAFAYQSGFADQERNAAKFRTDSHLIVGTDADLILLGLSSMLQNVFILNNSMTKKTKQLFSVWEFCRTLEQIFPAKGQCYRIRLDFILLSLLLGNDYLPKLRGASFERLWHRYKELKHQPNGRDHFLVNPEYTLNVTFLLALVTPSNGSPHLPPLSSPLPSPSNHLPSEATATLPQMGHFSRNDTGILTVNTLPSHVQSGNSSLQPSQARTSPVHDHLLESFSDPAIVASGSFAHDPAIISASSPYSLRPYYSSQPLSFMPPISFDPYLAAISTTSYQPIPLMGQIWQGGNWHTPAGQNYEQNYQTLPQPPHQSSLSLIEKKATPVWNDLPAELNSIDSYTNESAEDLIVEAIYEDFSGEREGDTGSDKELDDEEVEEEEEENENFTEEDDEENEDDVFIPGLLLGNDARSYIQGLFWCLKMYMEGLCPDNKWFYRHRYAPTSFELRNYFFQIGERGLYKISIPQSPGLPLPPHKFCITVLPIQARDLAHEILRPYMALDSKLAPIFQGPTVLVDVQLIDSVLSELPESSLPNELRFAHTHYYQRSPNAGYGERGWFPHPGTYGHQRYRYPPGPMVPHLLPWLPSQRYTPLWKPEERLKCAYYPTRNYPAPWLSAVQSTIPPLAWPQILDQPTESVDYLHLGYFRPFSFLYATSSPAGGHLSSRKWEQEDRRRGPPRNQGKGLSAGPAKDITIESHAGDTASPKLPVRGAARGRGARGGKRGNRNALPTNNGPPAVPPALAQESPTPQPTTQAHPSPPSRRARGRGRGRYVAVRNQPVVATE